MLNLSGKEIHQCDEGWLPVFTDDSQTLRSRPFGLPLAFRITAVLLKIFQLQCVMCISRLHFLAYFNPKLALKLGIQTYQILTSDDEVCIPSLSSILLAVAQG